MLKHEFLYCKIWSRLTSKDGFQPASLRKFFSSCCKRLPARGAWSASSLQVRTWASLGNIFDIFHLSKKGRNQIPLHSRCSIYDFQIGFLAHMDIFPHTKVEQSFQNKGKGGCVHPGIDTRAGVEYGVTTEQGQKDLLKIQISSHNIFLHLRS